MISFFGHTENKLCTHSIGKKEEYFISHPTYENIEKWHSKLRNMELDYWKEHVLFSWQWWLLLFVFLVPWIVWFFLLDKKRKKEITLFGSILAILIMLMDEIGVSLHLWSYPYKLVQIIPNLIPVDLGFIIVSHMLVYQYFRSWKWFLIINVIVACIFAFLFEPLTIRMHIYKTYSWESYFSLPIYVVKAILVRWLVDSVLSKKTKAIK